MKQPQKPKRRAGGMGDEDAPARRMHVANVSVAADALAPIRLIVVLKEHLDSKHSVYVGYQHGFQHPPPGGWHR
eukprot:826336-Amphidinium_carterae.1